MAKKWGLTYRTFRGIIEPGARVLLNELVFVEYVTISGKTVCSLPLPQLYACPSGLTCRITCEHGKRGGVISNAEYYNRSLHNYSVLRRFTEMLDVDRTNSVPPLTTQIAMTAKDYKYFLWNFTGEIQSLHHIDMMRRVADRCPDTLFVCRTRLIGMVTRHIQSTAKQPFPKNLRMVITPLKAPPEDLFTDKGFDEDMTIVKGGHS